MAEGPSAESKLNIATYFIMSSPTGELNDVVKDVTKLVQDPATLTDEALTNIIKAYNHEQMAFAPHPKGDGSHAMVSEFGLTADGKYFNPQVSQNLSYDHKAQKFSGATDGKSTASPALEKYRVATQAALDKYLEGSYKAGKVCGVVYAGEGSKLTICISAKNVHLGNFWTGGWRSCYGIDVKVGSANLTGTIKVNVHYFEDGNVQLHANVNQAAKVNVTAKEDETGTAIAGAIAKIENDFHSHLEEMYVKMHTTTFKQMRRFYSLQREPMRWSVAAHAMANEVAANKQQ